MERKTKSLGTNVLIVLLILVILASSAVGIWAWARYQTVIGGTATAQVAKWNFNLVDTNTQTTDAIEFAVTRTDNNKTVAEGKVAPGTYGEFEVGIDARGTETILSYTIEVAFTNKPTNMKFYLDANKKEELVVENSKLIKSGFMSLEDVKEIRIEKIYWDWPYETGSTEQQILENDIKDTEDESKQITMQITVSGTEVLGKTVSQTSMQANQPKNGENYQVGETITLKASFSDVIYAGENKEEITAQTAPVMAIKFDGASVAKIATTNSVNGVVLAEGNIKIAQFDSVEGNAINYIYTVETGDVGQLVVDSYTGKVYSEDGISLDVQAMKLGIEQCEYLADVASVGDYVNYNASSNGVKTFTSSDCLAGSSISDTISTDESFNISSLSQWRVLSVDKEKGIVELMAADPTVQTVTLSGMDGFGNGEIVLNNIGSIYGQGKGAVGGRSITVDDVEQYSSFKKTTDLDYGNVETYSSGQFYKQLVDENGNVTGYETSITNASSSSKVTMIATTYRYSALGYFSNLTAYNMIFKKSIIDSTSNKLAYWLASRSVYADDNCAFRMRKINNGYIDYSNLSIRRSSNNSTVSESNRMVPVVTLKTNIQTTGKSDDGVWQLKTR